MPPRMPVDTNFLSNHAKSPCDGKKKRSAESREKKNNVWGGWGLSGWAVQLHPPRPVHGCLATVIVPTTATRPDEEVSLFELLTLQGLERLVLNDEAGKR